MRRLLVLALCLLVMSGCRTLTVLIVNPDGSGTFVSEIEMENRYFELLSEQGDPIAALEENAANASFEVETERLDTDKTKGLRASFEFTDIEDMKDKFSELNTEETGGSTLFADATIGEEDTGWIFEAAQEGSSGGGLGAIEGEEPILDPEELKEILDARVQVTIPGAKGETNATTVTETDGEEGKTTTFEWELSPGAAQAFAAQTVIPDSFLEKLFGPLGLGILVGLLLIGGTIFILKKRGPKEEAQEPEAV